MREGELDAREKALAEIMREAGELARKLYLNPENLGVRLKGKQDYITVADGEVERLIVGRLGERFPRMRCSAKKVGQKVAAMQSGSSIRSTARRISRTASRTSRSRSGFFPAAGRSSARSAHRCTARFFARGSAAARTATTGA